MITISVREFQHHASKYTNKLPIVLTVYKKSVAKIIEYKSVTQTLNKVKTKPIVIKKENGVFCEKCNRKIGKEEFLKKNEDGKWLCAGCFF